jgi:crotonobetainyl-CoA:carnitine CoA-transferase CaiB-like acyl-CoA transferase
MPPGNADRGSSGLPLSDVRIIAATQLGAGPYALTLLSDLGADVIKLEQPGHGDEARNVPPFAGGGDSLYFQSLNRGARGLTLNLRDPAGREVLRRLVPACDVVFNNLRGGEPERLGLTYRALGDVHPRLVCCSLSGFGQTGPRATEPGYDFLIQAYAGFMSLTGEPDGPPLRSGISIADFSGGILAVLATMIGLWRAQRTGVGAEIDVSLYDTAISMLNYLATWSLNRDWKAARTPDSAHQSLVPSQTFRTADGFIVIMCMKEKFWHRLCERIGRPDLRDDPRFATFAERYPRRAELVAILAAELAGRTTDDWLVLLRGAVPCAPVYSVDEALDDAHTIARDMVVGYEHPELGWLRQVGTPIKIAGVEPVHRPASRLGADTDDVLHELGGYSSQEIAALRARGVV